jgi:hypothetical protein
MQGRYQRMDMLSNRPDPARENQEPARRRQEASTPDSGLDKNHGANPWMIFKRRGFVLVLLASMLPVGFALAQGAAGGPGNRRASPGARRLTRPDPRPTDRRR